MGWKEAAEPVLTRMPAVRRPEGHVPFKRKLMWTVGILMLYFFLTNISLLGYQSGGAGDLFGQFRAILAGAHGSVLQVGIGPIVTASIVLQLLGGANLLGLDTDDPRDQVLYQGLQKVLVVLMVILTGLPMVFAGGFLPAVPQLQLGGLTLDQTQVQMLMFAQIVVGGILILYMDEVVSKWGVGSGIGLFIIAGVSQRLVTGLINPVQGGFFFDWYRILTGQVEMGSLVSGSGLQTLLLGDGHIIALFTTVLIFGIVVYAESVRVEIPLSHARVKGARGRFPVKLIYASVLPMILVRAVQANIQFMGQILNQQWAGMPAWLGSYSQGQPDGGFFYYVSPIYSPQDWMWFTANVGQEWWQVMIRIGIDVTFMVVGGAIFAIFWVETTDMGPESTAKQIQNSGMQIPGFRQNVGVIEKVMERYIPQVTVIGGALVGLLAVWANMLGTIGGVSGTGLLLAVSITYKLYEEIAEEQMMEMHPMMRDMFGGGD
ncbi:preprotein translocase subunit SecY [Natrinema sp. CBA1119]|jgi:preprotein translocase subunit SecY|uniref:preprotein translocase subunit SecY n=1 Tax=unclassified Natrinema TaxID=2622230 RepID=UPI000BF5C60B|nr:preprotein translocase subunit SecY [Natrinema sp. CBA1119]PGF16779.1 preprotein translocase subunit SecY [Natrinema sp. CBA1119]